MCGGDLKKIFLIALHEVRRNYGRSFLSKAWFIGRPLLFVFAVFCVIYSGIRGQRLAEVHPSDLFELLGAYSVWYVLAETVLGSMNRIKNSRTFLLTHRVQPASLVFVPLFVSLINYSVMYVGAVTWFLAQDITGASQLFAIALIYIISLLQAVIFGSLVLSMSLLYQRSSVVLPVFVQFGFWLTPIFWSPPDGGIGYWIAKVNPLYLPIEWFRNVVADPRGLELMPMFILFVLYAGIAAVSYHIGKYLTRNALDFV